MKGRGVWIFSIFLIVAGCGDKRSPQVVFDDLLERISNVTGVPVPPIDHPIQLDPYPRPRDLVLPLEDIRVGFGTYLSLGRCGLIGEVSARNSSLGKFQSVTSRLLYEQRFLRRLKQCIEDLEQSNEKDKEFLSELESIMDRKTKLLPEVFWNATFASPEFRVLMSTGTDAVRMQSKPGSGEILNALRLLSKMGSDLESGESVVSLGMLESQYQILQSSKLMGQLLQAMVLSIQYLDRGSAILETAAQQNRLCPMGKKTIQSGYLFNVFQKYYIGQVQPYLSLLNTTTRPLIDVIEELVQEQKITVPQEFNIFYGQTLDPRSQTSLWVIFNSDISRHTLAWQKILKQCDLMPST